jgi:ankyrin repeat protein
MVSEEVYYEIVRLLVTAKYFKTALHIAAEEAMKLLSKIIEEGDPVILQIFIDVGMDINVKGCERETPLHIAAAKGDAAIVRILIGAGAVVNARNFDRATPLHHAANGGNADVIKLLIAAGADVEARDLCEDSLTQECTPLYNAAGNGSLEVVQALIDAGADVNAQDSRGVAPLHRAVLCGHAFAIEMLIKAGATVNIQDSQGDTPLHYAVTYKRAALIEALVRAGADINAQNLGGDTPLLKAIGHIGPSGAEFADILIGLGADVNIANFKQDTPLSEAARSGQIELAHRLIKLGADLNVQNADKKTCLHLIAEDNRFQNDEGEPIDYGLEWFLGVLKLLIMSGADSTISDIQGNMAGQVARYQLFRDYLASVPLLGEQLHAAVEQGDVALAKELLAKGAPGLALDRDGASLVHKAIRISDNNKLTNYDFISRDIIRAVGLGAVKVRDSKGQTPLHVAAQKGNLLMAEYLLRQKADVDALDAERNTPLHFATSLQMRNKLLRHGADFSICNCAGQNPIARNINIWIQDFKNPNI